MYTYPRKLTHPSRLNYSVHPMGSWSLPENDCYYCFSTCSPFLYLFVPCFSYYFLPYVPQRWPYPSNSSVSLGEINEEEDDYYDDEKRETESFGRPNLGKRTRRSRVKKENKLAPSADYEVNEEEAAGRGLSKTTVMIKNIPNNLVMKRVLDLLDEHCRDVNEGLDAEGSGAASEFDFLYLPMDFCTGNNLGYAFVNFTTPLAAWRLYRQLHMKSWASFGSAKICEVNYARIQGLHAILRHFKSSTFSCENKEYLPVHFSPSRDGFRRTRMKIVGKYVPKPK